MAVCIIISATDTCCAPKFVFYQEVEVENNYNWVILTTLVICHAVDRIRVFTAINLKADSFKLTL